MKKRWDKNITSLACHSRRVHHHPNERTKEELKLIKDMRIRNPNLGMIELWHRLKKRGYTRRPESLFRIMRRLGMFLQKKNKKHISQNLMSKRIIGGERIQIDVKVIPRCCVANKEEKLYQYTAIDEYTRLRYLKNKVHILLLIF